MNAEYVIALEQHNAAVALFKQAQQAYRSRQIDDEAFLDAKAQYEIATAKFDAAFAKEAR